MKPDLVWSAILNELQLQMTQATFDTWLRSTRFIEFTDGVLVVGVKNKYAKDWLEHRLLPTIERTLARLAGQPTAIRFVVVKGLITEPETPEIPISSPSTFTLPIYDVRDAGWFKVGEYERRFWVPALGRVAWGVIEVIRKEDRRKKKTEWTPMKRYSAPALAEQVPCGRQALLGVNRSCDSEELPKLRERYDVVQDDGQWRYYQPGAFDHLQGLGLAQIERRGEGRHTTYWISVRNQLGLLPPALAMELPSRLQVQHDQWLVDHDFDARAWDIENGCGNG